MNGSKLEKVLVYVVTVVVVGLASYVYLRLEKTVDINTDNLRVLSERLSKVEGSLGILSKLQSGGAIKVHSTKFDLGELLNVEGIRFKVRLSPGLDEKNAPAELRDSFSLRKDQRMYVHLEWLDLQGEHRVVVRWIMPDRRVYTESIYDTKFEKAVSYTWHWQRLFSQMQRGTWFVEILLDGQLLTTKSFKLSY
jgi:hypothetical protein